MLSFLANGVLKSSKIVEVMKKVDRGDFSHVHPYMDAPPGIGYGVTISAPHMVVKLPKLKYL